MEVVLQWLDEIDDLVFAGFSVWHRLRRLCLAIALGAAVAIHALPGLGTRADAVFTALSVSLTALACWAIVAAVSRRADQSANSVTHNA